MKKLFIIIFFIAISSLVLHAIISREVFATVPINNFLELKGGYMKAQTLQSLSPQSVTFEAWIKPDILTGIQPIVSIGNKNTKTLAYELGLNGNSLSLHIRYTTNSQKLIVSSEIPENVWTHIAASINTVHTALFINGRLVHQSGGISSLPLLGPDVVLGKSFLESFMDSNIYKGDLDEVRISQELINVPNLWNGNIYQNELSSDTNTVILWHLDENRGVFIAADSSGHGSNGVLIGGDAKIHFYGILPSPTPLIIPTIRFRIPPLPTLALPGGIKPSYYPQPTNLPDSTPAEPVNDNIRDDRPVYTR